MSGAAHHGETGGAASGATGGRAQRPGVGALRLESGTLKRGAARLMGLESGATPRLAQLKRGVVGVIQAHVLIQALGLI